MTTLSSGMPWEGPINNVCCQNIVLMIDKCLTDAFSALMLLVGQQEGHLTRKKAEWWG